MYIIGGAKDQRFGSQLRHNVQKYISEKETIFPMHILFCRHHIAGSACDI
jgi:hypothetical protein